VTIELHRRLVAVEFARGEQNLSLADIERIGDQLQQVPPAVRLAGVVGVQRDRFRSPNGAVK
jgi:hypothetical protein